MFRVREILVSYGSGSTYPYLWLTDPYQIRIRILLFSSVTFKTQTKRIYKVFCLLFFEGTFASFFQDKKSQSHKRVEQGFFLSFAWWWKDPYPDQCLRLTDPDGPKTYGSCGSGILISGMNCTDFYHFCHPVRIRTSQKFSCPIGSGFTAMCGINHSGSTTWNEWKPLFYEFGFDQDSADKNELQKKFKTFHVLKCWFAGCSLWRVGVSFCSVEFFLEA